MRIIPKAQFLQAVEQAILKIAVHLPDDVRETLTRARETETFARAQTLLNQCIENAKCAEAEDLPLCQDTGTTVFWVTLGESCRIEGGPIQRLLDEATANAYTAGYLRKSIVYDPLYSRANTKNNTPCVLHLEMVEGTNCTVRVALKGGGAENMSAIAMLPPGAGEAGVKRFILETVRKAGGNPCPPIVIGVGIGGNFETCALTAKKALFRPLDSHHADPRYAALETELLQSVNALDIGPQGLGGDTTALAVLIETLPCHIASMPVAVNINCHSSRHTEFTL